MDQRMMRRDFLRNSALLAGGIVLSAGTASAEKEAQKLIGYAEVDQDLFRGINRVQDPAKKTELEKKHAPLIDVPDKIKAGVPFTVTITIGEIVHPMVNGHYIQYVELYAGNEPEGRAEFRPGLNQPVVTFHLTLDKAVTLVAREYCNLHGLWESRKDVSHPGESVVSFFCLAKRGSAAYILDDIEDHASSCVHQDDVGGHPQPDITLREPGKTIIQLFRQALA